MWLHSSILSLEKLTSAKYVPFAMCMFGSPWQKYTTLMYSAG